MSRHYRQMQHVGHLVLPADAHHARYKNRDKRCRDFVLMQ